MNQSEKRQKWSKIIQEQKKTQLSMKVFCQQNNINYQTFYYWSKQLAGANENQKAQPIIIHDNHDTQFVAIVLPNGMRVELPVSLSKIQIQTWIEALL